MRRGLFLFSVFFRTKLHIHRLFDDNLTFDSFPLVSPFSFLGTGGQTLDDIYKYLPSNDRLSMVQRTLEWRHIAPTAPDTLCENLFVFF